MLKTVDSKNQILVKYLASINSSVLTGVLPQKEAEGSSKASNAPKKKKHVGKALTMEEEFSSQSTEVERMIHDEEPNDDDIMVSFTDIQFGPREENVPGSLIMSERLAFHSKSYDYEIQKLHGVAKEHHELFVEQVTKMKEPVDLKIAKLKSELSKEVQKMEQNYTLLHGQVDVITTAIAMWLSLILSILISLKSIQKRILRCSKRWMNHYQVSRSLFLRLIFRINQQSLKRLFLN
ncbi:unnamed protein product [Lactuca saligna]|uniref:Uncharacterized protein n=1 Tax=Lactuca saligna TaxID=75948 RepID=A0AA35YUV9_LACSI|nr:unnamed protein product [Lactuca saligna]